MLSADETTSGLLAMILERENFLPIVADNLDAALSAICTLHPDILVIDLPLAGIGSVELCMQLQACGVDKPTIILSDCNTEIDTVLALEAGADCYIVKPVGTRELIARIRALLRRRKVSLAPVIRFGNVEVDRERQTVICRGLEIKMNPYEYKLLLFFLANADLALTRQTLLRSVWGYSDDVNTRTLDAHVNRLRNKCEPDPTTPRHFVTIHGVGYRFLM